MLAHRWTALAVSGARGVPDGAKTRTTRTVDPGSGRGPVRWSGPTPSGPHRSGRPPPPRRRALPAQRPGSDGRRRDRSPAEPDALLCGEHAGRRQGGVFPGEEMVGLPLMARTNCSSSSAWPIDLRRPVPCLFAGFRTAQLGEVVQDGDLAPRQHGQTLSRETGAPLSLNTTVAAAPS